MMDKVYGLSDADVAVLKTMLRQWQGRFQNPRLRANISTVEPPNALSAYIGFVDEDGVSALIELPGTGTGGDAWPMQPGFGQADVYQILFGTPAGVQQGTGTGAEELLPVDVNVTVYNLSTSPIPPLTWVLLIKDAFGSWQVVVPALPLLWGQTSGTVSNDTTSVASITLGYYPGQSLVDSDPEGGALVVVNPGVWLYDLNQTGMVNEDLYYLLLPTATSFGMDSLGNVVYGDDTTAVLGSVSPVYDMVVTDPDNWVTCSSDTATAAGYYPGSYYDRDLNSLGNALINAPNDETITTGFFYKGFPNGQSDDTPIFNAVITNSGSGSSTIHAHPPVNSVQLCASDSVSFNSSKGFLATGGNNSGLTLTLGCASTTATTVLTENIVNGSATTKVGSWVYSYQTAGINSLMATLTLKGPTGGSGSLVMDGEYGGFLWSNGGLSGSSSFGGSGQIWAGVVGGASNPASLGGFGIVCQPSTAGDKGSSITADNAGNINVVAGTTLPNSVTMLMQGSTGLLSMVFGAGGLSIAGSNNFVIGTGPPVAATYGYSINGGAAGVSSGLAYDGNTPPNDNTTLTGTTYLNLNAAIININGSSSINLNTGQLLIQSSPCLSYSVSLATGIVVTTDPVTGFVTGVSLTFTGGNLGWNNGLLTDES